MISTYRLVTGEPTQVGPAARPPEVVDGAVTSIGPGRPSPLDPGPDGERPTALWPTHPLVRERPTRRREVTGEMVAATVLTGGAIAALVLGVVGLLGDLNAGLGDGMTAVAWTLGVLALVVLAGRSRLLSQALPGAGRSRYRTLAAHSHGHNIWETRLHEAGHAIMCEKLGGRVTGVTINPDGTGVTHMMFPPWADLDPIQDAAIAYAGWAASANWDGCGQDIADANQALRRYGWSARPRGHRKARSLAQTTVGHGLLFPRGAVARRARKFPGPR